MTHEPAPEKGQAQLGRRFALPTGVHAYQARSTAWFTQAPRLRHACAAAMLSAHSYPMIVDTHLATSKEIGRIPAIWDACWSGTEDSSHTKEMPHYAPLTPGDVLMAFVDDTPASCVAFSCKELQIGASRLRLGAIGDVATVEAYQRRGLASRLMLESVRRMADRADHVSALFTFSHELYRRFGWEVCGDYWDLLVYPAQYAAEPYFLEAYSNAADVRPASPADFPAIAALHEDNVRHRGWGLVRPPDYWRWAQDALDMACWHVADSGAGVDGYVVAEITPRLQLPDEFTFRRTDDPRWPTELGPVLHIVEIVARDAGARRALVGHLAARAESVGALSFPFSCQHDLAAAGLLVPPARVRMSPAFMFRVIDVAEALRALDDLVPPAEAFSISIADPAGINTQPVAIVPGGSESAVVRGKRCDLHLVMSIQSFSQLYAGYRALSDLDALGRIDASSDRAKAVADHVFPRREPFIGELDLF